MHIYLVPVTCDEWKSQMSICVEKSSEGLSRVWNYRRPWTFHKGSSQESVTYEQRECERKMQDKISESESTK